MWSQQVNFSGWREVESGFERAIRRHPACPPSHFFKWDFFFQSSKLEPLVFTFFKYPPDTAFLHLIFSSGYIIITSLLAIPQSVSPLKTYFLRPHSFNYLKYISSLNSTSQNVNSFSSHITCFFHSLSL